MTYDALNRITALTAPTGSYSYQRGATGMLAGAAESSGRSLQWSYDGIYRLTNETITGDPQHDNGSSSYSLDPVGNRLSVSTSLTGLTSGVFSYNPDDEVSSESYDANGNATQVGAKSFTYDSENHMKSMSTAGTTVSMLYDGDGNRIGKSVNGVPTYYLVDDLNPTGYPQVVEELNSAGVVQRQYTYGLQRISESQLVNGAWTPSFYGYDGGGNVRQLTSSAGAVTDEYEYDAFGNSFTKVGTTPNNYLYRGEQYDPDLGLYYLRARYYNALTGRFMSRDPKEYKPFKSKNRPIDPMKLHRYLYADGDPVNRIDPRGREAFFEYMAETGESEQTIFEFRVTEKTVEFEICMTGELLALSSLEMYEGWDMEELVPQAEEYCRILLGI